MQAKFTVEVKVALSEPWPVLLGPGGTRCVVIKSRVRNTSSGDWSGARAALLKVPIEGGQTGPPSPRHRPWAGANLKNAAPERATVSGKNASPGDGKVVSEIQAIQTTERLVSVLNDRLY